MEGKRGTLLRAARLVCGNGENRRARAEIEWGGDDGYDSDHADAERIRQARPRGDAVSIEDRCSRRDGDAAPLLEYGSHDSRAHRQILNVQEQREGGDPREPDSGHASKLGDSDGCERPRRVDYSAERFARPMLVVHWHRKNDRASPFATQAAPCSHPAEKSVDLRRGGGVSNRQYLMELKSGAPANVCGKSVGVGISPRENAVWDAVGGTLRLEGWPDGVSRCDPEVVDNSFHEIALCLDKRRGIRPGIGRWGNRKALLRAVLAWRTAPGEKQRVRGDLRGIGRGFAKACVARGGP